MKPSLIGAVSAVSLALAASTYAQNLPRAYVQGVAGPTFGTEASTVFAGGVGIRVGRSFQITGEIGRMQNVLPKSVQGEADALAAELQAETGSSVSVKTRARALYGTGGVRWLAPSRGPVHPYLGLTAGVAHVRPRVSATVDGVSLGVDVSDESMTKPLVGLGGGVTVDMGTRVAVELGYQYNRIFTPEPAIDTSRVVAAFLLRF
jgi:opacity protein-like surface antigen